MCAAANHVAWEKENAMAISDHPEQVRACLKILAQTPRLQDLSRHDQLRLLSAPGVAEIAATPSVTPSAAATESAMMVQPQDIIDVAGGVAVVLSGTFNHQNVLLGPGQIVGLDSVVGTNAAPGASDSDDIDAESAPIVNTGPTEIEPVTEGKYLWIPQEAVESMADTSAAFRQVMGYTHRLAEVVEFQAIAMGNVPRSLLTWMLGHEIVSTYPNDRILIVVPPALEPDVIKPVPGASRLSYVEGLPGDPVALGLLRRDYDYIFLDGVNPANVTVHRTVHFTDKVPTDSLLIGASGPTVLRVTIVDQSVGASPAADPGPSWVNFEELASQCASSVRVLLDLDELNSQASTWVPPALPVISGPTLGYSLGAFGRALTQRRTGVAVAGGGVWSMQAVYILRELDRRGVPVDVVVGPSGGAMIGGYYGVDGLDGLEDIVKQGRYGLLNLMSFGAMISPTLMKWFFDANLGCNTRIENQLREFYPSATDLSAGKGVVFRTGSLAKWITAASSAVPLVAATIAKGRRFVDGAYSNNVPVEALKYFDVALSFGANTFPPASRGSVPGIPNAIRQLFSLGPFNRLLDFVTAFNLLGSVSGATEGNQASVSWDSEVALNPTYVITINFLLSQRMVECAADSESLFLKLNEFEQKWNQLVRRGVQGT